MNESELQKLIDSYPEAAGKEDIERLDALVREDPGARRELLDAAAMGTSLRRVLAHAQVLGHASAKSRGRHVRPAWRVAAAACKIAAVLIFALAGWGATALYAQRYHKAEGALADTNRQLADLRAVHRETPPPAPTVQAGGPEVVDTRGWVRLLPANEDFERSVPIGAGTVIPAGRKMWTCPWGGAGTRFPDGTIVSLDRSTVAAFTEANGARQIDLKSGIVSVTHRPSAPGCGRMVLRAADGEVTFGRAEVTLAVQGGQTIVEVAGGEVEFRRASDGRTVKLSANQYAVIGSEKKLAAVTGSLQWRIEPPAKAGAKTAVQ